MKDPHGPGRGLTPARCNSNLRSGIVRIEYIVFTKAECRLAWKIFADRQLWPKLLDAYGSIEWQGVPWMPSSRLQIDLLRAGGPAFGGQNK